MAWLKILTSGNSVAVRFQFVVRKVLRASRLQRPVFFVPTGVFI